MFDPNELIAILERILAGSRDEGEIAKLRQSLKLSDSTLKMVSQNDKFNTNIGQFQNGEIHIGDRIYRMEAEDLRALLQLPKSMPEIDWQQVSRSRLDEQIQRLTTNPLTHAEGITYRMEQVYMPLGLVERKRQSRRREDVLPEQGSLLYEETEITQKFEHEAFLEQVLRQGHSPRSGGRRIAVIGEPGAGKTTLLQQIARWVAENIDGVIVIWVSLADLQGQELQDYLLERWLPAVVQQVGQAEASTQVKDAFVAQVQQGRVWLLLDGVDEMQVSSGNPLSEIEQQVRLGGLLAQTRMVLTCRLNLWDGNRHALDTFDTYRTLEFSYPVQVEQFVGQWFEALPDAQAGQAERLCAALKQPGKERIRDLVKNPLRLTLLCFNWYLGEGTLPETKAGLYEQFVADFYEWKRERFSTTAEQRRRLNAALGELAREAIDKEATRFRLRHDFVCEYLGQPNELDSLFHLALQLGWLNQVGVDAENRRKSVYAFFHPTFQEYFAALAINSWHLFLNHVPGKPNDANASYRIFERQWHEIFLLWIGRHEVPALEKENFLHELINFNDGYEIEDFYKKQAKFLSALGIAEFKNFSKADVLIEELIQKEEWKILKNSDVQRVIKRLIFLLSNPTSSWFLLSSYLKGIETVEIKDSRIADCLLDIIGNCQYEKSIRSKAICCFSKLKIITPKITQALEGELRNIKRDDPCLRDLVETLASIAPESLSLINYLNIFVQHQPLDHNWSWAAQILHRIQPDNMLPVERAESFLESTSVDDEFFQQISKAFYDITPKHPKSKYYLTQLLQSSKDEYIQQKAAWILAEIDCSYLLNLRQDIWTIKKILDFFMEMGIRDSKQITILVDILNNFHDKETHQKIINIINKIYTYTPEIQMILERLFNNQSDEDIRFIIAKKLVYFNPKHAEAVNFLSGLLTAENTELERCREIASTLCCPEAGTDIGTKTLLTWIKDENQDESIRLGAAERLLETNLYDQAALEKIVTLLVDLLWNGWSQIRRGRAENGLKLIRQRDMLKRIVSDVRKGLGTEKVRSHTGHQDRCYRTLKHCAQNLSYSDFYYAWHN